MSLPRTVVLYCNEDVSKIENYYEALESNLIYDVHHRLELDTGVYISSDELKEQGLYYNRPASELILLPHDVHTKLHADFGFPDKGNKISKSKRGHVVSQETKDKIKNSRLIHNSQLTDEEWKKEYYCSDETKRKISDANKGKKPLPLSEEARKKLSQKSKERWADSEYRERLSKAISDGVKRTYTDEHRKRCSDANKGKKMSSEFKENCRKRMLGRKMSEETKAKMRASSKHLKTALGKHWYTNGVDNIQTFDCPVGYWKGRTITNIVSEETRAKMRASQLKRQEEIRNGKSRTYKTDL